MSGAPSDIGQFIIGVSQIGALPALDWKKTVISQYANSPVLLQLIEDFFFNVDPTANFDQFYDDIWNVETAVGYGLDVWGRIVGVSRILQVITGKYFGFEEGGDVDYDPFNQSPFYSGTIATTSFSLSDEAYRQLIYAKALANITDGSIAGLNQILLLLFAGQGNAFVTDGNNMTMTYTFDFVPTPVQVAIIESSGVLPKPTGVAVSYNIL